MIYHFEEVFKRTPFSTKRLIEKKKKNCFSKIMFRFPYQPSKAHVLVFGIFFYYFELVSHSNHIYNNTETKPEIFKF